MENKKISVIIGIYNCAETLKDALDCIINQTYTNWEVIMCDDGSTDSTVKVAELYVEKYPNKFILLKNNKNLGINKTLNRCLEIASGNYIARMDGDDLCAKDRFEKEVNALELHPHVAIVSTDMSFFDEMGVFGRTNVLKYPTKYDLVKSTQFCHAACMVRREAYEAVNGYSVSEKLLRVEDYHLWIKMYAKGYRGMNIQETLYSMRDDRNAQKRRKFKFRLNEAYVKIYAVNQLKINKLYILYCIKPILIGIMPSKCYRILHRKNK